GAELDVAEREPIEPDQAAPARRAGPEKRPENKLEKQKTAKVAPPEETRARGADAAGRQRGALDEPPASNAVGGAGPVAGDLAAESSQAATSPGGGGAAATATPEPPKARDDSADRKSDADGRYRPYRDKPLSKKEQGWLDGQEIKLSELARNKRCREAAAIANDILDRNPEFYTRRIGGSKQMEPCRWYVGQEQKRRAARRVQAPRSTKSSGGAQQKVRAAPAKDEAAVKEKQ
ncbi:MAG TPA: hypothetical protein VNO33_21995, partial [Kofleriaceae bacterium]|nr:hypothetical protein [Kofleriaceae bacterium]